ncbi:type III secretion apparatus assembly chaperone SctY [Candidatus Ichthyocystis hellenicum]|uniref:type III secretion apparatus assembly chaperone SctY n=1 Tax=Candidatus Ichthyocystis hellenicum TaxID=1561003 RepID=UPI000B8372E5|nr:hypothetical protein [Candidatus Ichthyocystis hellenicum]
MNEQNDTKNTPRKPIRLSRDERDVMLLLSYQYLHYGKFSQAKDLLVGVHTSRPRDLSVLPLLAYAQLRCKKPKNALKIMYELRRRDWNSPEYYLLMAQVLQEVGDIEESRRHYKQYVRMQLSQKKPLPETVG